ncbi:MAG: AMP-binding protein [Chloroflexi bacterium]|nr:AMP-binding protein [Chloroflexota bacterium]
MAINLFKSKPAATTPGDALLQASQTPLTIPAMVSDASARYGQNVLCEQKLKGEWHTLTADDAWRQANDFAAGLIALGLEKGDRVAVICENGLPWVVTYFGLSLAGGVGVPLYVELKRQEIEELVQRSGARFVIASAQVVDRLGDHIQGGTTVIVVGGTEAKTGQAPRFMRRGRPDLIPFDQVAAEATDESRAALAERKVAPDDLASIVFTSGTTGGMKGVMLTHKNIMSNVESVRRAISFDEKDRLLLVLPLHHSFPFTMFLISYAVGGKTTFENDLLRVRDRLKETKPTIFLGVPALFDQLYRAIVRRAESDGRLEKLERALRYVDAIKRRTGVNVGRIVFGEVHQQLGGNLRFVMSGGAALKPEVARSFFRLGLLIIQGWGLSEASPAVAAQRVLPRRFLLTNYYEERAGTVGQAIPGVEVSLIDVPEKEIYVHLHGEGELVVRGPNVFAGYWQAEEETAAAKAGGWLRTGDLGRIDDEGNIWITGRSKYVIVLDSGEKVVPDELEERFSASELLQDVCIVPRTNRNKTQVGAIIYPNLAEAQLRLQARGEEMTEANVRKLVQDELDSFARELSPHKRVSELILSDTPLPKTALQDLARGQMQDSYGFDLERWRQTSAEELEPTSEESEAEEATPAANETDDA